MKYGSNWFKGCRDLFEECIREGHPHDYFIFTIIVARARFNGNLNNLEIGQAFIGLDELGKLVRATRQEVRSSLKRLTSKHTVSLQVSNGLGTAVTILNPTFYKHVPTSKPTGINQLSTTNIDKIRLEKNSNTMVFQSSSWNKYIELYTKKYNKNPTLNKQNEKWSKELDALGSKEEVEQALEHYFADTREYYKKVRFPLYAVIKDFDQHRPLFESKQQQSWVKPEGEYV